MSDPKTESEKSMAAFKRWWMEDGRKYKRYLFENEAKYIKRMCFTAWENGAFKQRERDERK